MEKSTKFALWGVSVAVLASVAGWMVVAQFRHATNLNSPPEATASTASQVTGSEPRRLTGVFAASIEELRERNHVTLMPASESEKTLGNIPAGSYGFVFGPLLAHSAPRALEMYAHSDRSYFEVHKISDSQAEFVGYVGVDTQERLRKGIGKGEKVTLYSSPWPKAPNLTAISLGSVKCPRSWDVAVRRKGGTIILFALECKAI